MKKLLVIASTASALGLAASSFAASAPMPMPAAAPAAPAHCTAPGWYLGIGAGYGEIDAGLTSSDKAGASSTSEKRGGFLGRIYGGYMWDVAEAQGLQLGLELGYNYHPKTTLKADYPGIESDLKADITGWSSDLLGVAKYNFGDSGMNIFGKGGFAYTYQKVEAHGTVLGEPASGMEKKKSFLPEAALGVGYDFNRNVGIDLSVARIFGKDHNDDADKVSTVNMALLGVTYHFDA